jgi:predicted Zn-dependent protease
MANAGYDPREMLGVMQILKKASGGGRQPEFLSSHPLPETRLQELETIIKQRFKPEDLQRLSKGQPLRSDGAPHGKPEKW